MRQLQVMQIVIQCQAHLCLAALFESFHALEQKFLLEFSRVASFPRTPPGIASNRSVIQQPLKQLRYVIFAIPLIFTGHTLA